MATKNKKSKSVTVVDKSKTKSTSLSIVMQGCTFAYTAQAAQSLNGVFGNLRTSDELQSVVPEFYSRQKAVAWPVHQCVRNQDPYRVIIPRVATDGMTLQEIYDAIIAEGNRPPAGRTLSNALWRLGWRSSYTGFPAAGEAYETPTWSR